MNPITPNDVAKVTEAADSLNMKLSPAEAAGVAIMHRLDPETLAKLQARLDNNEE